MNRKNLTAAVLAGLAGIAGIASTAQAVNLNPDGLGQVLIYPYYTVNGGNLTTLSVVNTSEDAKAVKVRFLEGQNSLEVLDFNLYLSAYDVWTAAIINSGGTPTLVVDDTTCTVPDLLRDFGGSQAFLTFGLNDGGPTGIDRAREGHFEMIEMGTLIGASAAAATHKYDNVYDARGMDGDPGVAGCATLVNAWAVGPDDINGTADDGYWLYNANQNLFPSLTDIEAPSGGLFGGGTIVNPKAGTMYSYEASALNGYANDAAPGDKPLHTVPSNLLPSLGSGGEGTGYVFTDQGGVAQAHFTDSLDAVSYVFMHDSVMNEYITGGALAGSSEWVLTFPTKNAYVNGAGAPVAPFVSKWGANADTARWEACEPVFLDTLWDQEEENLGGGETGGSCPPIVSPAPPTERCGQPDVPFELCFETNVIRFGAGGAAAPSASDILGSTDYTNIDNVNVPDGVDALGAQLYKSFPAGWARIDLLEYPFDSNANGQFDTTNFRDPLGSDDDGFEGNYSYGLPVTGFWVFEARNGYLTNDAGDNVLANYGGLFSHKATRCFAGEECRRDGSSSAD